MALVRTLFGYETYHVPSNAMIPTLDVGDFIIADTWLYRKEKPRAGDVVAYEPDPDSNIKHVMRIVGVPGDELELREGTLFVNGRQVPEEYLDPTLRLGRGNNFNNFGPIVIGQDYYFMLGDNRGNSWDSRFHGPIPIDRIIARVEFIWLSTEDANRFPVRIANDA